MKSLKGNQGFSLVELIVVIAIMAILVGVAVPVYSGYIQKAQETKDAQYLDELSRAVQIFAAEKGIALQSVWVAPEVKEDRGVELVLQGGEVYSGDMSELYAMLGGAYDFETIDKTQEITYREDILKDTTEDKTETSCSEHVVIEKKAATCLDDGYKGCDNCDYYERILALGHNVSEKGEADRIVGNLHIYKCKHAGCDYVTVVAEGNKIG